MRSEDLSWNTVPIREMTSLLDPFFPKLTDIYQDSFPLVEQMKVSFFINLLKEKNMGGQEKFTLDILCSGDILGGFALYENSDDVPGLGRGGYLWYIASNPDLRGLGIGKILYHHVKKRMFEDYGCRAMLFEIEEPADVLVRYGEKEAEFASWRKDWYRRQGACELQGTRYMCGVGWQPAIPMQVMVHPNGDLSAYDALKLAWHVQDESIELTGSIENLKLV
jgi:hypothetical protein